VSGLSQLASQYTPQKASCPCDKIIHDNVSIR
jgi:hypothetical protein